MNQDKALREVLRIWLENYGLLSSSLSREVQRVLSDPGARLKDYQDVASEIHRCGLWPSSASDEKLADAGPRTPEPEPLTDNDCRILCYLLEMHPRLRKQDDIAAGANVSRGTVGDCLSKWRGAGLVHRPEGERKGEGLTDEGRRIAENLPPDAV